MICFVCFEKFWECPHLHSQISQPQDPLPVRDDDGPDVALGPVLQDVVDVALVVDGDEEALKGGERSINGRLID